MGAIGAAGVVVVAAVMVVLILAHAHRTGCTCLVGCELEERRCGREEWKTYATFIMLLA
jgi:hypothetical protein